jgi:RNA polymerase sigma-70 factor (sigma-E family)
MADPSGFEEYVAARRDTLVRAAYLLAGDLHQAEDLVQAALIRVWPRWEKINGTADVDAYVRRVLYTVFLTSVRRRRWRELLSDPLDCSGPEPVAADGATGAEARMDLRGSLRTLPPRQRAVLVLRYFLDLPEAETADILGCSVGTVKSQSSKAIKQLRAGATKASVRGGEGEAA